MAFFSLVQLFYWLSLATWFGGVVFIAISMPVISRTIRENDPTLPTVLSVNLDGEHSSLLAGTIVVNLLVMLTRFELALSGVIALALAGQWVMLHGLQLGMSVLRTCLFVGAVALALYDWRIVTPRILKYRNEYIEHADEPELAEAAKSQFDHYFKEVVTVLLAETVLLSGMILFSSSISTAQAFTIHP